MEEKFCPVCGEKLISEGYDYDYGHVYYTCPNCDWYGSDMQVLDEEQ